MCRFARGIANTLQHAAAAALSGSAVCLLHSDTEVFTGGVVSSGNHQQAQVQHSTAADFYIYGLQEVDRSGAGEAAAPRVLMRHFTAALQRVPPSVSARDRRLYDAMRSQVTLDETRVLIAFCLQLLTPRSGRYLQLRQWDNAAELKAAPAWAGADLWRRL